jgi:uncharacterized membrane protein YidH (DUF202 family)
MLLNRLRHAPWLRTAMRVLVLCFALGTLAYASHSHELSQTQDTHYSCDFCTSFGGLIDAPIQTAAAVHWPTATEIIAAPSRTIAIRPVGVAQARAPPAH